MAEDSDLDASPAVLSSLPDRPITELVFDPNAERWRVYESSDTTDMSHQEMIDHASDIANNWLTESLTDRIAATEESDSEP